MGGGPAGGDLPAAARARIAAIRRSGSWDSALTTGEFAAIRSAGFEPAGQVYGAAVYPIGWTLGHGAPGAVIPARLPDPAAGAPAGRRVVHAFGPLIRTMDTARRVALRRMTAECTALGGHGVVGVSLTIGEFPVMTDDGTQCLEFRAIGTAVRAPGSSPGEPFTSDLSGQDFAKLIMAGWAPVRLAMGISIGGKPDDPLSIRQRLPRAGNAELDGITYLVNLVRHDARTRLQQEVAQLGGSGAVVGTSELKIRSDVCPWQAVTEFVAEATIIGTAITPFRRRHAAAPPASLAILPLRR